MSQHYRKKHRGISDPVRAYLQDCGLHYHRSATSKDPVFDCMLCLRRFVNASDHKKKADAKNKSLNISGVRDHLDNDIHRVFCPKDPREMPEFVQDIIATLREPKNYAGVLIEYFMRDQRKRAARKNNSTEAIDKRVTKTFQLHLNRLWVTTAGMMRYQEASKLFDEIKEKGEYKASSMVLFIVVVRRFLIYVKCNQKKLKIPYEDWDDTLKELSSDHRVQMKKDMLLLRRRKDKETPTLAEGKKVVHIVKDTLDSPTSCNYSYNLLKGLTFFYFQVNAGTRPGPIQNLRFENYARLRRGESVHSVQHKTGSSYNVTYKLNKVQVPYFNQRFAAFRKETGEDPLWLFPTLRNGKERCMFRFVNDALNQVVPGSLLTKKFTTTAIRRVIANEHVEQTAHDMKTEEASYLLTKVSDGSITDVYARLFNLPTDPIVEIPTHMTPEEFDKANCSTIYFNTELGGPIFPHLHGIEEEEEVSTEPRDIVGTSQGTFRTSNNVEGDQLDQEEIDAKFQIVEEETNAQLYDDDSYDDDSTDEDSEEDNDNVESDPEFDENVSTISCRKDKSIVPASRRPDFVRSLQKFNGKAKWKPEEKSLCTLFAHCLETTPSKAEVSEIIKGKLGRPPSKQTVVKIYDKLKALVNRLAE